MKFMKDKLILSFFCLFSLVCALPAGDYIDGKPAAVQTITTETNTYTAAQYFEEEISSKIFVNLVTNSTTALSASGCKGHIYINNDDSAKSFTLPLAEAGLLVSFANALYAKVITVDVAAGDIILLNDGTALDAGDAVDSAGAITDKGGFLALNDTYWMIYSQQGAWADGGAE